MRKMFRRMVNPHPIVKRELEPYINAFLGCVFTMCVAALGAIALCG